MAIATRNRAQDLDIAYNQQQDLIFQECLTTLGKLIEKYGQELNESSSASLVARFATLSALHRLDRNRRNSLVRLLYESKLITYRSGDYQPPILLYSTNLTDLNLHDGSDQGVFFHLSLEDTIMTKADFHESHIPGARFNKAILIHANFSSSWNSISCDEYDDIDCRNNFEHLFFEKADLTSASFFSATYDHADFTLAIMINANLNHFFCENCIFISTVMNEVNLQHGDIRNSSFAFATLDHANFYQANFGLKVDFYGTNMNSINATYTNLTQCDFNGSNLLHTTFDHAMIMNSSFSQARMENVSMQYTRVMNGNFINTDLSGSNWRYAFCQRCIFDQANLTNADLSEAIFIESDFRNCIITDKQLKQTVSLEHSILPNGNVFITFDI